MLYLKAYIEHALLLIHRPANGSFWVYKHRLSLLIYPPDIRYWTCWTKLSLFTYSANNSYWVSSIVWVCSLTQLIVVMESPSMDWVCLLTQLIVIIEPPSIDWACVFLPSIRHVLSGIYIIEHHSFFWLVSETSNDGRF